MTTKVIRENTRKRFTEVAVAVEEIGNSMTLTLKVLAEGKHKKSSLGVFLSREKEVKMNIGSEKQRDRDEKVVEIEIERLHDLKKYPFKVQADSQIFQLH